MGLEIEIKLRLTDREGLLARLRSAGARARGCVFEQNHILDTAERRLRQTGCGLRVREWASLDDPAEGGALLTYKGPRAAGPLKVREEVETDVADGAVLLDVLGRLGYAEVIAYQKRREVWMLDAAEIAIDEAPRLGWFVEIEGPDAATVAAVRTRLGLDEAQVVPESYVELAARHGEELPDGRRRLAF